jgi:hypothetical protein
MGASPLPIEFKNTILIKALKAFSLINLKF